MTTELKPLVESKAREEICLFNQLEVAEILAEGKKKKPSTK